MFYGLHIISFWVVSCSNKGRGGSWTCVGLTITMVLIDENACELAKRGRQNMNILREKGYGNDLYLKLIDNCKGNMITTTKCKVKVWTLKDEYSKQQTQQAIWRVTNNKFITTNHESKPKTQKNWN